MSCLRAWPGPLGAHKQSEVLFFLTLSAHYSSNKQQKQQKTLLLND